MFRKTVMIFIIFILAGCATVSVPSYLADGRSYQQRVYADHDLTLQAVRQALKESGWVLEREEDPRTYEAVLDQQGFGEQRLLMTSARRTNRFFYVRQERVNVFVRSSGGFSDLEVRYLALYGVGPAQFKRSGGRRVARQFFELVDRILEKIR